MALHHRQDKPHLVSGLWRHIGVDNDEATSTGRRKSGVINSLLLQILGLMSTSQTNIGLMM
ncbi:hypothetical protein Hdeb2414_s0064g00765551 [Helianthus debilis subsp. tardiflorus]